MPVPNLLRRLWQPLEVETTLTLAAGLTATLLLTHPLYFDQRPSLYGRIASIPILYQEWHWGMLAGLSCALMVAGFCLAIPPVTREVAYAFRAAGLGVGFVFWILFAWMLVASGGITLSGNLSAVVAVLSFRGLCAGPGAMRNE